ncbi:nuclear transport factor 2 family protein [Caulobacter sp. 3R27C2-B]|uniref:nuclear transport factor 2 family protein n=1 Tax=Caulobacter sp. 3R27C2-B TaxID=2502219 RepID=UPI001BB2153D|nr:nuclear transport factor 2 family protein [Caulobacter sp. 3R27C2-B]
MMKFAYAVLLMTALPTLALAQTMPAAQTTSVAGANLSAQDKELISLSQQKWRWMAEKNVAALDKLFDEKSIFVHMSRTMTKPQELEVIRTGNIEYRKADVSDVSVRFINDTAIVWSRIELQAIVGGNVANNPFTVTETFVKVGDQWKLGALVFSAFRGPPAVPAAAPK